MEVDSSSESEAESQKGVAEVEKSEKSDKPDKTIPLLQAIVNTR